MEFVSKDMKEIIKTDAAGTSGQKFQYNMENAEDPEITMAIKTPEEIDILKPGSTIRIEAGATQTTVKAHAKKKKGDGVEAQDDD